ncbi:hypothetical protein Tco_0931012 [Tanacetum coccineum]
MKVVKEKGTIAENINSWKDSSRIFRGGDLKSLNPVYQMIDPVILFYCQSNDSAGSIGTSSEHSIDLEFEISRVPSEVYVSTPITTTEKVWTNTDRINHAYQFVPRPVQLNAGRPNINSVRPNINTGRTNINYVRPNVNTGRTNVNPVRPRVNTGSSNVNTVRSRKEKPQKLPTKTSKAF